MTEIIKEKQLCLQPFSFQLRDPIVEANIALMKKWATEGK